MIPWSLTAFTINNVLPVATMIMVLVVIGYDDDDADNDVDHFQVLPNAISKVVVFIFMAIKL